MENILDWARAVFITTPLRWESKAHTLPVESCSPLSTAAANGISFSRITR